PAVCPGSDLRVIGNRGIHREHVGGRANGAPWARREGGMLRPVGAGSRRREVRVPGLLVVTPAGPDCDALCSHLRERGYVVHNADSGAVAVDVALRRLPDVILMDPALSAMDRWHAVKRLNTEIATSTIPVLTLASDAASPAGLQRVVSKVEQTVGRRGRTVSTSAPPVRTEPPAPRVDDRADALADALV